MPIINLLPDETPSQISTVPQVQHQEYKSQFTNLIPTSDISSLLKYIEGMPWSINYYGQLLNKDNGVNNYDPSIPSLLQPYYKINKLVVKVSSALDTSYNNETGVTTISGTALFPFSVIPNVGDAFVANVDTGEDAVFTINSVTRKTFNKNTLYDVTYTLTFFLSAQPSWVSNMEGKVQQVYYYKEEDVYGGKGTLAIPSVFEANNRLISLLQTSMKFYFDSFFNVHFSTIVMPGQADAMYDPLLIKFLLRIVNTNIHPNIRKLSAYSHGSDVYLDQSCVWDVLLSRDLNALYLSNKKYKFVSSYNLSSVSRLASLKVVGLNNVIYPMDANVPLQLTSTGLIQPTITSPYQDLVAVTNHNVSEPVIYTAVKNHLTNLTEQKLLLHTLFSQDYYVLSKNFYDHVASPTDITASSLSFVEHIVYKFMNRLAIAPEDLVIALQDYPKWPIIHQVYLLPVMWLILKANGINF